MIQLPTTLLYPHYSAESCDIDLTSSGFVRLTHVKVKHAFGEYRAANSFWFARTNLRWFAKALHACATYDRANATVCCEEVTLVSGGDGLSVMDNGADYGVLVIVENDRGVDVPHGSTRGGYVLFMSLPLAELLANELLALSASDDDEAP